MRTNILNREFQIPKDDWYHIEVSGEHENRAAGVVQVIDEVAINNIVKNFDPGATGMLIDTDHHSHDMDKSTVSYGWLEGVQNRDGQLYGKIRWTNTGKPAVEGGDFRLFSSEYAPADLETLSSNRVRPVRLSGLTLTNRPNNKGGVPISNRDTQTSSGNGEKAAAELTKNQNKNNKKMTLTSIAAALGLAESATEEEVLARIEERNKAFQELEAENAAMSEEKEEVMNREADALIKEHSAKIGSDETARAFWKQGLMTNRESTEKALIALPAPGSAAGTPKATTPIHNRANAQTPEAVKGKADGNESAQADAIATIKNRDKCSNTEAYAQAKRERPELF